MVQGNGVVNGVLQSESNVVVRSSNSGKSVVDGDVQLRVGMEGVSRDTNTSDNVSASGRLYSAFNLSRELEDKA